MDHFHLLSTQEPLPFQHLIEKTSLTDEFCDPSPHFSTLPMDIDMPEVTDPYSEVALFGSPLVRNLCL